SLQDQGSSLQLPSPDKLQDGSFLTPRSAGPNHKRTLFTLQRALLQVPSPDAPDHLPTYLGLCLTGLPGNLRTLDNLPPKSSPILCSQTPHLSFPWRFSHLFLW
ncbi:hypothetical protein ATANTOWER_026899, partial [Ataeniobius toweri]|nr:hypothetical protein [Ataeniobius toweri]